MAEKERETPNILVIEHNIYLKTYTLCISVLDTLQVEWWE